MRKLALPLALAATLATASLAFAAPQTVTNTIKSLNAKAMTITLSDGTVYELPAKFKISSLKIGEKVVVTWDLKGKKHIATAVVPAA